MNYRSIRWKCTALLMIGCMMVSACSNEVSENADAETSTGTAGIIDTRTSVESTASSLDTSDMFTDRDKEIGYDESKAVNIELCDDSTNCDNGAVSVSGNVITISDEGTYVISGSLSDGQIRIEAEETDKIQLVLDGVDISCDDSAVIYVKSADKVFITLSPDTKNTLTVTGEFINDDDNNVDGAIFSKCDITLNGKGKLDITCSSGHGIVSKKDLVITSGTYNIDVAGHGLQGKDSVRVANGSLDIVAGKDGIHSENNDDEEQGFVYIADGNIMISAEDDGIHAGYDLVIDGGKIDITKSYEGLEGLTITINDGDIMIMSSDDGLNAAGGRSESSEAGQGRGFGGFSEANPDCDLAINGGTLTVNAGGDGLDSNGTIQINGGYIIVDGPTDNGNAAIDYETSGVITGGTVIAVGASGMVENFSDISTQASILAVVSQSMISGAISLTASDGTEVIAYTPAKSYNSVVISTPDIKVGENYTLMAGDTTSSIEMTELLYGEGSGFGMRGPGGGFSGGDFQKGDRPEMPEGGFPEGDFQKGDRPEMPEGGFPEGDFQKGDRPEMPEGGFPEGDFQKGDRPEMPKYEE